MFLKSRKPILERKIESVQNFNVDAIFIQYYVTCRKKKLSMQFT